MFRWLSNLFNKEICTIRTMTNKEQTRWKEIEKEKVRLSNMRRPIDFFPTGIVNIKRSPGGLSVIVKAIEENYIWENINHLVQNDPDYPWKFRHYSQGISKDRKSYIRIIRRINTENGNDLDDQMVIEFLDKQEAMLFKLEWS